MERSEMPYLHGPSAQRRTLRHKLPPLQLPPQVPRLKTVLFSCPLCCWKISEWEVVEEPAREFYGFCMQIAKFMRLMQS